MKVLLVCEGPGGIGMKVLENYYCCCCGGRFCCFSPIDRAVEEGGIWGGGFVFDGTNVFASALEEGLKTLLFPFICEL